MAELVKIASLLEGRVRWHLALAQALFVCAHVAFSFGGLLDFLKHYRVELVSWTGYGRALAVCFAVGLDWIIERYVMSLSWRKDTLMGLEKLRGSVLANIPGISIAVFQLAVLFALLCHL